MHKDDGICPFREFLENIRIFMFTESLPSELGIRPTIQLSEKTKVFKFVKSPNELGIEPTRLFLATESRTRLFNLPNSDGIEFPNEFEFNARKRSREKELIDDGIPPVNELLAMLKVIMFVK